MPDWNPSQYLKFKNQRTQPTIDLVNRIDVEQPKRIIDIGCGPGNSTAILQNCWPNAEVFGLDNSPAMLEKAKTDLPSVEFSLKDTSDDLTVLGEFDVVFSNAALQWMPSHETLIQRLFNLVSDGGVLAVQVPFARDLPIYITIREMIQKVHWESYFKEPPLYPKHYDYHHFYEIISEISSEIEIWQTEYVHEMDSHEAIMEWYKGSGMLPYLEMLPVDMAREEFCMEYLHHLTKKYPVESNGKVLLPFPRIFFIARQKLL